MKDHVDVMVTDTTRAGRAALNDWLNAGHMEQVPMSARIVVGFIRSGAPRHRLVLWVDDMGEVINRVQNILLIMQTRKVLRSVKIYTAGVAPPERAELQAMVTAMRDSHAVYAQAGGNA